MTEYLIYEKRFEEIQEQDRPEKDVLFLCQVHDKTDISLGEWPWLILISNGIHNRPRKVARCEEFEIAKLILKSLAIGRMPNE